MKNRISIIELTERIKAIELKRESLQNEIVEDLQNIANKVESLLNIR